MRLIDQSGKWALELGSALLAFGSVEHALDVCINYAAIDEKLKKEIKTSLFSSRATQFIKATQGKEHASQLVDHLKDALIAAKTRNKIAHNPIVLRIYEDTEGFTLAKAILRDKKSEAMEFEELKNTRIAFESLADRTWKSAQDFIKTELEHLRRSSSNQ